MVRILTYIAALLILQISSVFGQQDTIQSVNQDALQSTCSTYIPFLKPEQRIEYKTFKKGKFNNQLRKFCGNKLAKEYYCEAMYMMQIKEYKWVVSQLFCAYKEANCIEFKFKIIQTTQQVYELRGDTLNANKWQAKVDTILSRNPNITTY